MNEPIKEEIPKEPITTKTSTKDPQKINWERTLSLLKDVFDVSTEEGVRVLFDDIVSKALIQLPGNKRAALELYYGVGYWLHHEEREPVTDEKSLRKILKTHDVERLLKDARWSLRNLGLNPGPRIIKIEDKKSVLDFAIDTLDWSARIMNLLNLYNIKTIRQLIAYSEKDLMKMEGFGYAALEEVKDFLRHIGLSLTTCSGVDFDLYRMSTRKNVVSFVKMPNPKKELSKRKTA
jgi:hypothetical protein